MNLRIISLLSSLYFVQGLPFGFQAVALPVYLRENGTSLAAIGYAGILAAPWMFKIFLAPLVDRYGSIRFGRRKTWIVPLQVALCITCFISATIVQKNLNLLFVLIFAMNLFAAAQDIAVDGLAVDLLKDRELGPGNAAQVVGYKMGMVTGGGLLVWASRSIGWNGLFQCMGGLVGLVAIMILVYPEAGSSDKKDDQGTLSLRSSYRPYISIRNIVETLIKTTRTPSGMWVILVVATYKFGENIIDAMFKPFLIDSGFTASQIGLWVGTWGMMAGIAGSAMGGFFSLKIPMLRALAITAFLRVIPLVGELWLTFIQPDKYSVITVTFAEHFFGGALTTAMFAFMMSKVDKKIGATHFTLLATIEVMGKSPGYWFSGVLAESMGYSMLFTTGIILSLLFLLLLIPLKKHGQPGDA